MIFGVCTWCDIIGKKTFSLVSDWCSVFFIKILFSAWFLKGKYISELLKRAQNVDELILDFHAMLELFEGALRRMRGPRSSCTAAKIKQ